MGANLFPDKQTASFRVWAPDASQVTLRLWPDQAANHQDLPLSQDVANATYFSADISGVTPGTQYRFLLTNNHVGPDNPGGVFERLDPYARAIISADAASPGVVIDPAGTFSPFTPPSFENFLIYQLHIGSFAGLHDAFASGEIYQTATFRDIVDKLDYIRSMNFNAVQFLPATSYAFHRDEGYAPKNFFAPELDYGQPEDLRFLVEQCHQRGLAVIFDVVYNHAVAQDAENRLLQFDGNTVHNGRGIYFSLFDNFGPVPDFDRAAVRAFFLDNARMCFREYHIDGLRFDSAHAIRGQSDGFGISSALQELIGELAREFPDKFLIAEYDNPTYALQTYAFDAAWQMGVADNFLEIINAGSLADLQQLILYSGYPTAFSPVRFLLGSHDQIYAAYQQDSAGQIVTQKPYNRYFVEREGGVIVGRDNWTARAKARLGWALNVTAPGTPMLFMGTEVHHHGYWNPAPDVYGDHRFDWDLTRDAIGTQMRTLVGDINQVRWDNPALRSAGEPLFTHFDAQNRVLAFKRFNDQGNVLLTVVNISENQWDTPDYGVSLAGDDGSWEEIFNSQSPQYGGWNNSGNYLAYPAADPTGHIFIRLPKWSVLVFRKQ
jgi:1,4-alpha-glucan branching enzyme